MTQAATFKNVKKRVQLKLFLVVLVYFSPLRLFPRPSHTFLLFFFDPSLFPSLAPSKRKHSLHFSPRLGILFSSVVCDGVASQCGVRWDRSCREGKGRRERRRCGEGKRNVPTVAACVPFAGNLHGWCTRSKGKVKGEIEAKTEVFEPRDTSPLQPRASKQAGAGSIFLVNMWSSRTDIRYAASR